MIKSQARQRVLAMFTTLANGKAVKSIFRKTSRMGEIRDVFEILDNPYTRAVCGGKALTIRIDRRSDDGTVTKGRAEACSWSINALTEYAQELDDAEAALLDRPCERLAAVQKVARLLDAGECVINGKRLTSSWSDMEGLGKRWAVSNDADFSADELLTLS